MNIGSIIRYYRETSKLTQTMLADRLGVSFQTISNWERNIDLPDTEHLILLAKELGVRIDDLFREPHEFEKRVAFWEIERMYTRVKTVAETQNLPETLKALPYAREKHSGQLRKSKGETALPYIYHPLTMACHCLAMGICDDSILAAVLLHDVYEDCGVDLTDLPVNDGIRETVRLLSHNAYSGQDTDAEYYANIMRDPAAAFVKCVDRCHNLSSMAIGFTPDKIVRYIHGTERYVIPILVNLPKLAPQWSNAAWLLKYQMFSLLEMAKRLV